MSNDPSGEPTAVPLGSLELPGTLQGRVYLERYISGRAPAISLTCTEDGLEQPYTIFSVNLTAPRHELRPWEFFASMNDGNAGLVEVLQRTGFLEPVPGVRIEQQSFCDYPVWRITPEDLTPEARSKAAAFMGWPEIYERSRRVVPSGLEDQEAAQGAPSALTTQLEASDDGVGTAAARDRMPG